MFFGTRRGWLADNRLDNIEEEDLQDLLEKCEHDHQIRPMHITNDIPDGLPWYTDIILRFLRYICFC